MPMKRLEQISMWLTLFSISFCFVFLFNQSLFGALASGATTATVKTPVVLIHNRLWLRLKQTLEAR